MPVLISTQGTKQGRIKIETFPFIQPIQNRVYRCITKRDNLALRSSAFAKNG
jgi:hypothetical protein